MHPRVEISLAYLGRAVLQHALKSLRTAWSEQVHWFSVSLITNSSQFQCGLQIEANRFTKEKCFQTFTAKHLQVREKCSQDEQSQRTRFKTKTERKSWHIARNKHNNQLSGWVLDLFHIIWSYSIPSLSLWSKSQTWTPLKMGWRASMSHSQSLDFDLKNKKSAWRKYYNGGIKTLL